MLLPDDQPKSDLHPDRLRALSILLGLPPPPKVEQATILLLGVSIGANLLALACEYPQATFTAMAVDARAAKTIQQACVALRINNVKVVMDVDFWQDTSTTTHDYILCHGYYSYLSTTEKQQLNRKIAASLSSNGMAYIDYLIEPGWQSFANLQHLIRQTCHFEDFANQNKINQGINMVYPLLPESSPLRATIEHIVPNMNLRTHPSLNGYWCLIPAQAETAADFFERLHGHGLGYVCDSHIHRYYFQNLSPELAQHCGLNVHKQENVYDLVHEQASRASIIMPMAHLLGFRLPSREAINQNAIKLHISGRFELNASQSHWISHYNHGISILASPFNNMVMESISSVAQANATLSVAKLLEAIELRFRHIDDISHHAMTLIADLVLTGAVHIRSQRQNGFKHQNKMAALHQWRLKHSPYLTPADKWLMPWAEPTPVSNKATSNG